MSYKRQAQSLNALGIIIANIYNKYHVIANIRAIRVQRTRRDGRELWNIRQEPLELIRLARKIIFKKYELKQQLLLRSSIDHGCFFRHIIKRAKKNIIYIYIVYT